MTMPRGRYAQATDGLLRATVLDTVADLVIEHDWDRLSMAKIATEAGVSRQTLYNEFGDRDGLLEAYIIREAGRFLDGVEAAIVANTDDLEAAVLAALRTVLETADDHPVVHAVVTGQASVHVFDPLVATPGRPVLDLAAGRLTAILESCWPEVDVADFEAMADTFVRLAISHLTEGRNDTEGTVDTVRRVFGPVLRELAGR